MLFEVRENARNWGEMAAGTKGDDSNSSSTCISGRRDGDDYRDQRMPASRKRLELQEQRVLRKKYRQPKPKGCIGWLIMNSPWSANGVTE